MTTERAGMLMPSARVSVANTTFTRPSANASSTASFIGGTIPAWWAAKPASSPAPGVGGGEPRCDPRQPLVVAEDVEVVVGEPRRLGVGDGADPRPFVRLG